MTMHAEARRSRAHSPAVVVQITPALIAQLAAVVEAGIDLLDQIGGDPDLEDDDPAEEHEPAEESGDDVDPFADCEDADPGEDDHLGAPVDGDDWDAEPSLGWTPAEAAYGCHPLSGLDIDREEDSDIEPSLGAPERGDFRRVGTFGEVTGVRWGQICGTTQEGWGAGSPDERELDDGDHGIADRDGLIEQYSGLLVTGACAA